MRSCVCSERTRNGNFITLGTLAKQYRRVRGRAMIKFSCVAGKGFRGGLQAERKVTAWACARTSSTRGGSVVTYA